MCAKFSTNLLKRNKECYEKRRKKRYWQDLFDIIKTSFPAIACGIVFVLESIIDSSIGFSLALALFSTCVTAAFEINEWYIFINSPKNKTRKSLNYNYPLLFALILLMVFAFTYNGIAKFISIPNSMLDKTPNLISSLTLLAYFISYTKRQLSIRKLQYLNKEDN